MKGQESVKGKEDYLKAKEAHNNLDCENCPYSEKNFDCTLLLEVNDEIFESELI